MIDEQLINKWLKERVINKSQAKRMLYDVSTHKKERSSNKFILTISTIGSILLGIGAILFIASNWREISNLMKVIMLLGSTIGAYYFGYLLKYQKQNLPKVGISLMFLGALLFGATIILVSQIYNLNANNHVLVLIWLIGVLPLVYALNSMAMGGLASLLFFIWIGLFFNQENTWWFFSILGKYTPFVFFISSIMLFAIGGMHYTSEKLNDIARIYRIAGLKVMLISMLFLTFNWISQESGRVAHDFFVVRGEFIGPWMIVFSAIAIAILIKNWFFDKSENVSSIEGPVGIGLIILVLISFFFPSSTNVYVIIFNLVMFGLTILLVYAGYQREDMKLVNMGVFWIAVFIVMKYFDWFYELLPRSLFFLAGGIILLVGGIVLEKKRKNIKEQFTS